MTDKRRRQRGSRTHGGGSQKKRRGAGHRGGRGNAGRSKHEPHGQDPLGKHGFTRPPAARPEVLEVALQRLDEDVTMLAEAGVAEPVEDGYRIDARDVAEDGHEADVVKVLGGAQLYTQLEVVADAFSASARAAIEDAGGQAILTDRASDDGEPADDSPEAAEEPTIDEPDTEI